MFLINILDDVDYNDMFHYYPEAYDLICSVIAHLMFENARHKHGHEQELIDLAEKVNKAFNGEQDE